MQNYEQIFDEIFEGRIFENEIKKILLDLNSQNLPLEAFIGAVSSLKKRMKTISAPQGTIDVCGTGGDKLNTLNISTAVSFVVAASGVSVAKHGNKAISSKSGSADIFSELGVKISSNIEEIEKDLREKKLCFLYAPFFHESLKNLMEVRKSLGVPTIINFLGPLLNPANTRLQLIGTARHDIMRKMAETIKSTNRDPQIKAYIVHGFDNMDEITLTDNSYLLRLENGLIHEEEVIDPVKLGFKKVSLEELKGQDAKYNAAKLLNLLDGERSAYRDIVVLNSAFALKLAQKVNNVSEGVELAKSLIDKGLAKDVLQSIIG